MKVKTASQKLQDFTDLSHVISDWDTSKCTVSVARMRSNRSKTSSEIACDKSVKKRVQNSFVLSILHTLSWWKEKGMKCHFFKKVFTPKFVKFVTPSSKGS